MFGIVGESSVSEIGARKAMEIMIELYRKRIWNDIKTVNAISTGIYTKNPKLMTATLHFFLGAPLEDEEETDEEEKNMNIKKIKLKMTTGKKTRAKTKKFEAELSRV
jgi:protein SDA1